MPLTLTMAGMLYNNIIARKDLDGEPRDSIYS